MTSPLVDDDDGDADTCEYVADAEDVYNNVEHDVDEACARVFCRVLRNMLRTLRRY